MSRSGAGTRRRKEKLVGTAAGAASSAKLSTRTRRHSRRSSGRRRTSRSTVRSARQSRLTAAAQAVSPSRSAARIRRGRRGRPWQPASSAPAPPFSVSVVADEFVGRLHPRPHPPCLRPRRLPHRVHRQRPAGALAPWPRRLAVAGGTAGGPADHGMVVGDVTTNDDPDKLGRVKLMFPWLSDDYESDWARLVQLGAGPDSGAVFLPEVNDEVLVAFEFGDVRRPYVLGGLFNGRTSRALGRRPVRQRQGQAARLRLAQGPPVRVLRRRRRVRDRAPDRATASSGWRSTRPTSEIHIYRATPRSMPTATAHQARATSGGVRTALAQGARRPQGRRHGRHRRQPDHAELRRRGNAAPGDERPASPACAPITCPGRRPPPRHGPAVPFSAPTVRPRDAGP